MIRFTIWATSEEVFRQRWIDAGILEDQPGYVFRPAYPGVEITANQGWSGIIAGIPGWHANAYVTGPLEEAMTAGLPQTDEQGDPLPLFSRTWAAYIFGLTEVQAIDPATGFPYGATTEDEALRYGDPADLKSPANVRQ
jgi:hypothetical protein